MEIVKQEGNDSLDMLIRREVVKDPFLSFPRFEDSPVQLFQLLHNLERPGWPLLTPVKIQMKKCEKCNREFCSPVNYRRHNRIHRRLRKPEKDFGKERDALGAFWDKLSVVDAKEILSLKSVMLEEVPGTSIESGLVSLVEKSIYTALPQLYLRAGSEISDIVQARPPRFPISSLELFNILDDASEKTFLSTEAAPMQKYIFDGETGKNVLEDKNVVACASFLLEQRLIKAWLADKDAEALRCQKLLVEEEEAAQRRQAELLERKKRKKLRQKEQRVVKDLKKVPQEDESTTSEEQRDSVESSSLLSVCSDSEAQRSDSVQTDDSSSLEDPQVLEPNNVRNSETQAPMVDANGHNMVRSHRGMLNGFNGNHAAKLGSMRKNGTNRDARADTTKVWSRKADNTKTISADSGETRLDQANSSAVLIGSVSVAILNSCPRGEQNQTKTVKVCRKDSTFDENTDKEDKNSKETATEVKTSHLISLKSNNNEAKAFLAKRWKEATSGEHMTLVLSQETHISNGVATARQRLKPKREQRYVPKHKIT
ncbi:unnamed protein product [Cochlearia groenlandica]